MGDGPRGGKVRWLGSLGVIAALMTACGSAQTVPSVSVHAQASPTPSPASATSTLPPLPPPQPIPPLVGVASNSNAESLYSAAGARTAAFPDNDNPVSPLGDRLLAEQQTSLDGNGGYGVDALVAITSTGAISNLETIADPKDFIDAIGSEDGTEWAWMMKGPVSGCAGNSPETETDVYIGSAPGQSKLIATLPVLKPLGLGWTFHRWTAAGIVLSEGGPPGCYEGPQINPNHTDLLNPTTGTVTPLAPELGSGDCLLQDMADDGTVACIPSALVAPEHAPALSATVLRIVLPGGAERNVVAAPFLKGCATSSDVLFGNVLLSAGPELVSLTRWCAQNGEDTLVDTWIIDIETLNSVKVSVTEIGATGWLPGTTTLIATGDLGVGSPNTLGTYAVAADGAATQLTTADIGMESFEHF